MSAKMWECGCRVTIDMFSSEIVSVHHCPNHMYLRAENKMPKQMADELEEHLEKKKGYSKWPFFDPDGKPMAVELPPHYPSEEDQR